MEKNKKLIATSIAISLFGFAHANQFNIIVGQDNNKYDVVANLGTVEGEWTDEGMSYNCLDTLDPNDYYFDMTFTQIEECDQNQEKEIVTRKRINGEIEETVVIEDRVIKTTNGYDEQGLFLAESCKEVLNSHGSVGDGLYKIIIDSSEKTYFCDMTTDGGGWTVVADQNLYTEGYPTANAGIPNNDPNDIKNSRLTRWPKYSEYAIKSVIDLHGAPYDTSLAPEFRKFNTGSFGIVEVDIMSFLLDKNDYQNGRAKDSYVTYNGVPWGDSNSHPNYYGYYWFGKSGMTYNHWGQADAWGHIVNSDLFRIASTETGYARTAGCGAAWAANDCRLAKNAWVYRGTVKQKAIFIVR